MDAPDSFAALDVDPVCAPVAQTSGGPPAHGKSEGALRPADAEKEFAAIESAVASTARGRWFLEEFARRVRARDVAPMVAALERVERRLAEGADLDAIASTQESARGPNALSTLAGLQAALRLPEDFAARLNAKRAALSRRPLAPPPDFIRKRMELIEQSSRAPGRALPMAEFTDAAPELEAALQQIASVAAETARAKQAAAAAKPALRRKWSEGAPLDAAASSHVSHDLAPDLAPQDFAQQDSAPQDFAPQDLAPQDFAPQDLAQGLTQDLTQDLAQDLTQDLAQDLAQQLAQDLAQDLSQDLAQELAQDLTQGLTQDLALHDLREASQFVSGDALEDASQRVASRRAFVAAPEGAVDVASPQAARGL